MRTFAGGWGEEAVNHARPFGWYVVARGLAGGNVEDETLKTPASRGDESCSKPRKLIELDFHPLWQIVAQEVEEHGTSRLSIAHFLP